jgi:disulfide bond formation protein DsbB
LKKWLNFQDSQDNDKPCLFCRRLRIFLSIVCVLLALLVFEVELSFLKNVSLTAVVADAVGIGLVTTLIWKVYHEYWNSDDDKKSR